ncbi:putative two-component system sensor kinase [Granulicella sibirica]|uniref:Putative two-component system sensor kinase n=1 Tax=Granulicella sibirica TaxID=2479048 RepID=A0A4Q0T654_9BACT|nr:putative two-component system sensor kinase [Granulicella sibirica]
MAQGLRPASALDGKRSLAQYVHNVWGVDNGYIGGDVYAIAKSSDGFLWLGTEHGLVRFDGFEFTLIQAPLADQRPIGAVRGMVEDRDGTLWIRLDGPRLLRYRDGIFEDAAIKLSFFDPVLTAMAPDHAGNMFLWGIQKKLLRFRGNRFQPLLNEAPDFLMISIVESTTGSIWLGTRDSGLYRVDVGVPIQVVPETGIHSVNALAPSEHGGVWIGSETGLHLWENGALVPLELPGPLRHAQVLALVRDRYRNLWVGTDNGMYRLDSERKVVTGFYRHPDDPRILSIYEDDEGGLWFAGSHSIERFRDGMFTAITKRETELNEVDGPVFADDANRTWFAPATGGLFCLEGSSVKRIPVDGLGRDVIYSIDGSKDELWLGRQHGGLTELMRRNGHWVSRTFTQRDGLAQDSVYTVTRAHDGSVWAGTVSNGVSVLRDGRFKTYAMNNEPQSKVIFSSLEAADKKMWFTSSGGLMSFDGDHWVTYPAVAVVPRLDLLTVFEDSGHVLWVGTSRGLARFEGGQIEVMHNLPQALSEEILNIAQDSMGFLWVVTGQHVLQIDRTKLMSGNLQKEDVVSYGGDDGLIETQGVRRNRSLVSDPSGRIWFSSLHSLAVADVSGAAGYPQPVRVRIESATAEGISPESKQSMILPPNTQNITFRYGGTNLAMPERTRFRYRLDGLDQSWSIGASSRQVVFTPLSPGSHTFRIMASSALGVWNGPESDIVFQVQPALWQTWYFRTLGVILGGALGVALYRFRLMQVTSQLNRRFQDRLAERTRIAQDLHDTLLQDVISASMQLDVAQDYVPEDSAAKPQVRRVLHLMRQATAEGRAALRGLRTIDSSASLEEAFKKLADELSHTTTSTYEITSRGTPRDLKPAVRDEVCRIGREAYINAVSHAKASKINITVEYGSGSFHFMVTDNGCGIDSEILKRGRDGHWGLAGMKERAREIGCAVKIRSHTPGGTEVELSIPAAIAYVPQNSERFYSPWQMLRRYSRQENERKRPR